MCTVHARRHPHTKPRPLWRRARAAGVARPGWQLDPPRYQDRQAATDWAERACGVRTVYVRDGMAKSCKVRARGVLKSHKWLRVSYLGSKEGRV